MPPLVSILIPAYNAEPYLAETLRSALAQTWARKEIVVVDDGSKDGTAAVARSFADAGIRFLAQPNAGAAAARNRAFRGCSGDYIQYLDADDLLAPDKIEVQLRRLEEEGPDCVAACRWGRFFGRPETAWFVPEPFWTDLPPVDWLVSCRERVSMMHPGAWLVPRRVVERAGPWDESLSLNDDGEYFCRVVLASHKVCFCADAVSYYRSGLPSSLSGSKSAAAWLSEFRSVERSTAHLLAREDSPRVRRACARQYQNFVYAAYPDVPDLIRQAEQRVAGLGGGSLPCPGGPKFRLVAGLLGWRGTKRLQRMFQRLTTRLRGGRCREPSGT